MPVHTHELNLMKASQSGKKCEQESKTRRGVSFSETNKTYKVLAIGDYTDKEIAVAWFNRDELHIIAQKCQKRIQQMKNNIDTGKYCIRGLERMAGARKERRNRNKCKAYETVLYEQEDQFEVGRDDQELIARLYHSVSAHCQIEATKMGLSDEHAVDQYLSRKRGRVSVQDDLPKPQRFSFFHLCQLQSQEIDELA
jgi:hypothetical protein